MQFSAKSAKYDLKPMDFLKCNFYFETEGVRVNFMIFETKIMIFGCNTKRSNQNAFYLDKDQIEITHEYKYVGIDFYSHSYFEPSSKR